MKIQITMEIDDEMVDSNDTSGLSAEGFERVHLALSPYGDDILIEQVDDLDTNADGEYVVGD